MSGVTSVFTSKMSDEDELLLLSAAASAATIALAACSVTRSSADADNRLDAFSGQSRSTNMVPFHM